MSKFSSDSDDSSGERRRRKSKSYKSKVRSRSSSSSSSGHYSSQKRSTKHKRIDRRRSRSRSKSRHTNTSKSTNSRTSDRTHSRSSSKSRSSKKPRAESKTKSRTSSSRSYRKSRSRSKERSKLKSHSSSESLSSPDLQLLKKANTIKQEPSTQQQLQAKLQKAIRAAQTADNQLRQQGLLPISAPIRSVGEVVEPSVLEPVGSVLDEINDSSFVPKQFISSKSNLRNASKISDHPIIDLSGDLQVAPVNLDEPQNIFHSSLFVDPSQKLDKWVKKLFHLRQKAINGEPMVITIT